MGYSTFKSSPKALTTGDQIGDGQIELRHLAPSLFSELRQVSLHTHSGVKSRRVKYSDIDGYIGKDGFIMYSDTGAKKYRVRIDNATGNLYTTEIT